MDNLFDKRKKSLENEYFQKVTSSYQQQAQVAHSFGLQVAEWLQLNAEETEAYAHDSLDIFTKNGNYDPLVKKAHQDLNAKGVEKTEEGLEALIAKL